MCWIGRRCSVDRGVFCGLLAGEALIDVYALVAKEGLEAAMEGFAKADEVKEWKRMAQIVWLSTLRG